MSFLLRMAWMLWIFTDVFFDWCNPLIICACRVFLDSGSSIQQRLFANVTTLLCVFGIHMPTPNLCMIASVCISSLLVPDSLWIPVCAMWPMLGRTTPSMSTKLPLPLANGGNTCYMNATLQCLWASASVRRVLSEQYRSSQSVLGAVASHMSNNLTLLSEATYRACDELRKSQGAVRLEQLWKVYHKVHPRNGRQQDAHEFLEGYLLDDPSRPDTSRRTANQVARLFTGRKEQIHICSQGHEHISREDFSKPDSSHCKTREVKTSPLSQMRGVFH